MNNERLSVFGITLTHQTEMVVLSERKSIEDLLKAIKHSEFICFKTYSKWDIENEIYELKNVVIKSSDISAIYW